MVTGMACIAQALMGHKRAIMEGQSGLWWGVILMLTTTAAAQGIPLDVLGGSLTTGVIISAGLTIIIGLSGAGPYLAKLFNPAVMGVFMFLFGCQLIGIFLKGMLGIPFGNDVQGAKIDLSISLFSIIIAAIVAIISIKAPSSVRSYGLLIGIVIGWMGFSLIFEQQDAMSGTVTPSMELFPLGDPVWNTGIIITTVLTGLLNTANTFGALKGTDGLYQTESGKLQMRSSFTITGIFTGLAGLLGLVPYAPYVSSIGFLNQTGIIKRLPFVLGGFMFFVMGVIPPIGHFFSMLPLSVGSAVLFVAYLQMLNSSFSFFREVEFTTLNIYRSAIPLFVGILIMTFPASYFESLPDFLQPLISSGLLVGITLALMLENLMDWDKV
nr:uracil/xanthine transporter [Salinicoccus carnicancri]